MHDSLIMTVWTILGFVDPVIVYLDASFRPIGRSKAKRSFLNLSAVEWGCATAILGLFPLILYLYVREKLLGELPREDQSSNPVRRLNIVILLVSIHFWMIGLLANYRAILSGP